MPAVRARAGLGALLVATALLAAGCGTGTPTATPARPTTAGTGGGSPAPYVGYPDSIVVLGHSGSTGESSDPAQSGVEVRANSWATGSNPDVRSLYTRLLARHPAIRGHEVALSQGGATVADLVDQAQSAVDQRPPRPLLVIQIMDNDIVCPAAKGDFDAFGTSFRSALRMLDEGLPTSRILVVGQFGSVPTSIRAMTPAQRRSLGGTGPCAALDQRGRVVPKEVDRLETVIHGYEAALAEGCHAFSRCTWDDGRFGNAVDRQPYMASDLNQLLGGRPRRGGPRRVARAAQGAPGAGRALSDCTSFGCRVRGRFGKGCQRPAGLLVDVAGAQRGRRP